LSRSRHTDGSPAERVRPCNVQPLRNGLHSASPVHRDGRVFSCVQRLPEGRKGLKGPAKASRIKRTDGRCPSHCPSLKQESCALTRNTRMQRKHSSDNRKRPGVAAPVGWVSQSPLRCRAGQEVSVAGVRNHRLREGRATRAVRQLRSVPDVAKRGRLTMGTAEPPGRRTPRLADAVRKERAGCACPGGPPTPPEPRCGMVM